MSATRILIVDDDPALLIALSGALQLRMPEILVETCDSAIAAVQKVSQSEYDAVVTDIKMPGMDGLTAAERIVSDGTAAVLILTAFSQRDLVHRAAQAGAIGYLVKPFQKSDLVPAIEIALARHAELAAVRKESRNLSEQLATRKLVDRAKGKLMDEQAMTEAEAFRSIQKRAMDERRSMRAVAEEVLGTTTDA